jgi:hypothetical protein
MSTPSWSGHYSHDKDFIGTPFDKESVCPLRFRRALAGVKQARTRAGTPATDSSQTSPWLAPLAWLAWLVGGSAAFYLGLYLGVGNGIFMILDGGMVDAADPIRLLEGLVQMVVGWVVFLGLAFGTAALVQRGTQRARRSDVAPDETVPEKEHILGYD